MKKFFTTRIRELSVISVVMFRRTPAALPGGTTVMTRASRRRGSPFPLPARLADGLGLRSGLGSGGPPPYAPAALLAQNTAFGFPAPSRGNAERLRLLNCRQQEMEIIPHRQSPSKRT